MRVETEILDRIKVLCQQIFQNKLVGIYIHGSIAFQCFHWESSDIDFLVVVNEKPVLKEKTAFVNALLEMDESFPPKGVEMSIVLESVCMEFQYPTPFELHFSNFHKERCRENPEEFCLMMNGTDKDLAAHFTVLRKTGITLWGRDIQDVFGEVPRADFLDSIMEDITDAKVQIRENPVYIILNLCRVLAYIREGAVLSKEQGADWGIRNLPDEYHEIIENAKHTYRGEAGGRMTEHMLHGFVEYMQTRIREEKNLCQGLENMV